ncbi:uncharacterized protein PV09_05191 [Verruconis gallopava]|uniref:Heterokaryon incompatibility domain-containing protein n=1 Tax=Verruconis gallopava TaxID=253628 RepID=A0A0D1XLX8_9PEZI|nr:uncharacterized protein PV09_05191 [Verruconis gallopava]KIW03416.1 hypothetical protein PV09_05191 [Verruconis gallopava]
MDITYPLPHPGHENLQTSRAPNWSNNESCRSELEPARAYGPILESNEKKRNAKAANLQPSTQSNRRSRFSRGSRDAAPGPSDLIRNNPNMDTGYTIDPIPKPGYYTGDSLFIKNTWNLFQIARRKRLRHQYHPLKKGYIRVLYLHPGDPQDAIFVSMATVPLDEAPNNIHYEALSYVWGDDTALFPIYIFNMTRNENHRKISEDKDCPIQEQFSQIFEHVSIFPVRKNLYSALHRMRKLPPRKGEKLDYRNWWRPSYTKVLWVDAICMNQKDIDEKNKQLPLMAEVYKKAQNVCIWLGEATPMNVISMDLISELKQTPIDEHMFNLFEDENKRSVFLDLMRNQWFGRRWILQELFYAQKATIHFGAKKQDSESFFIALGRALEILQESTENDSLYPTSRETLNAYGATVLRSLLFSEVLRRDALRKPYPTKALDWLIAKLTPFDAGDPRDIVFAVYNLAKNDPCVPIPPTDYNSSVLDVFTRMIEYSYNLGSGLDIILRCWVPTHNWHWINLNKHDRRRVDSVLPSWMRTLDKSAFGIPSEVFGGRINGDSFVGETESRFKASGSRKGVAIFGKRPKEKLWYSECTPADPLPSPAPHVVLREVYDGSLQVHGQVIGRVCERSDRMLPGIIPRDVLRMGGWKHSDTNERLELDGIPERLWRTLIAASTSKNGHNLDDHSACLRMMRLQDRSGDIRYDVVLKNARRDKIDRWLKDYLERARVACYNRRAILVEPDLDGVSAAVLQDGTFFGLAPDEVQVGDTVAVIYGCSVPVVLRQVRERPPAGFSVRDPFVRKKAGADQTPYLMPRGPSPEPRSTSPAPASPASSRRSQSPSPAPSDEAFSTQSTPIEGAAELWAVVGDCYVDGMMDGEAVDENASQRVRSFVLV